jgi:hypothetical protein
MLLLCELSLWMDLVSRTASKNNSSVTRRSAVANSGGYSCTTEKNLIHLKGGGGWERLGEVHDGNARESMQEFIDSRGDHLRLVSFRQISRNKKNTGFREMVDFI